MLKIQLVPLLAFTLVATACIEEDGQSSTAAVSVPEITVPSVKAPSEFSPHAAQLADAVQQSQARLASSRSDVCPKLIEFSVGNATRIRQNEIMRRQSCKYFLYPSKGDTLSVSITNQNMKAEMVQPKHHNFSNGGFSVKEPGKHVLQISYKNHHGDRQAEHYDLTVKK